MQNNLFNHGGPYWSVIPLYLEDFLSPRKEETSKKSWADWAESLWLDSDDGGLTFRLEVVGFGREHVSVKITDNVLSVSAARDSELFDRNFIIPSPEKLDLSAVSAKVEHGLLEIVFPAKKQEAKTIKVL